LRKPADWRDICKGLCDFVFEDGTLALHIIDNAARLREELGEVGFGGDYLGLKLSKCFVGGVEVTTSLGDGSGGRWFWTLHGGRRARGREQREERREA